LEGGAGSSTGPNGFFFSPLACSGDLRAKGAMGGGWWAVGGAGWLFTLCMQLPQVAGKAGKAKPKQKPQKQKTKHVQLLLSFALCSFRASICRRVQGRCRRRWWVVGGREVGGW